MKKAIVFVALFLLTIGLVSATDVEMSWEGEVSSVYGSVDNGHSSAKFNGGGQKISGSFSADDDNYGKVEVKSFEATAQNGFYDFQQTNDNQKGHSVVGLYGESDNKVNVFAKTDEWRRGNSLKTTRYSGSWQGTEHPVIEATGNYHIAMYGENEKNSKHYIEVVGNQYGGIGTERAGSDSVVHVGSSVSATNNVVRTTGQGSLYSVSKNANTDFEHHFG